MKVCLVSMSRIEDDPRVRRQGDTLTAVGHDVLAIGYAGGQSEPPSWPVRHVPPPIRSTMRDAGVAARQVIARTDSTALRVFWGQSPNRQALREATAAEASLYLANDWRALPVAAEAAMQRGSAFAYDSHELGVEEFSDRWAWRTAFSHYVRLIENRYLGRAVFVSTVGDHIADALHELYRLPNRPLVVRSVPAYRPMPFREPGFPVRVLYQGQLIYNRGIEALVASVPGWRPEFHLDIRGPGPPRYVDAVRRMVDESPAAGRITLHPPAPYTQLVDLANEADIGIHPLQPLSAQTRFSLPNKFFEYVMAGLALCVSDLPEMADLLHRHDLGRLIRTVTPEDIAEAVNGFDAAGIARWKRRSLVAAEQLCWEVEQTVFLDAIGRVNA